MTPRRRYKIQIVSIISFCVVLLIFIIYIVFTLAFWGGRGLESGVSHIFSVGDDSTKEIFGSVISQTKSEAFSGEKLIHLDLKGAPPLVSFLKEFFPYIKKLGATGLLIEYEDMFYYKEELKDIRALNAYQPSDIRAILELAEANNLSVIPLVQTFGHLEFVLKLENFKDLREVKEDPQVLCPSHEKVFYIIKQMIDQVLEAHPKAKYIHIGCDEVTYLGECEKCKTAMHKNNWTISKLFLNHVKNVALYINKTYPGVRPILWGDMIAIFDEKVLNESQISNLVDLMVWKYVPNVSDYITEDLLSMFARVFKSIWIASAFKGATGVNQVLTDAKYHLANHIAWMKIVSRWKNDINFKGIAMTGWQRYNHFAELCELLPVAIVSLTLNLNYISDLEEGANENQLLKILQCRPPFVFSRFDDDVYDFSSDYRKCNFPGFTVHQLIRKFINLSSKLTNYFSLADSGWFSIYNVVHNFINPPYVAFRKWPIEESRKELRKLEEDLKKALLEIYDEFTVEEWILTRVTPLRLKLEAFYIVKEAMLEKDVWPRRPLLNNSYDFERAAREICTSEKKFGCALLLI